MLFFLLVLFKNNYFRRFCFNDTIGRAIGISIYCRISIEVFQSNTYFHIIFSHRQVRFYILSLSMKQQYCGITMNFLFLKLWEYFFISMPFFSYLKYWTHTGLHKESHSENLRFAYNVKLWYRWLLARFSNFSSHYSSWAS